MSGPSRTDPVDPLPAFLDGLVNFGGIMIVRSMDTGRFLMVNPAFERVHRPTDRGDRRQDARRDLPRAEDAAAIRAPRRDVLAGVDAARSSSPCTTAPVPSAASWPTSSRCSTRTAIGSRVGSIAMDVTDDLGRGAASQAARFETETRFRAVFDHAPIGQIFSDVGGQVTSVNAPMAAMLGYRPDEMVGRPVRDFTSPAEFARISDRDRAAARRRGAEHQRGAAVPAQATATRCPCGSTSALLRDRDGKPRWWVSMVVDITDEERARAELERRARGRGPVGRPAAAAALDRDRGQRGDHARRARTARAVDRLRALRLAAAARWCAGPTAGRRTSSSAHGDVDPSRRRSSRRRRTSDHARRRRTSSSSRCPRPEPRGVGVRCDARPSPDDDQREVLGLVASETARVIEREPARGAAARERGAVPLGVRLVAAGRWR